MVGFDEEVVVMVFFFDMVEIFFVCIFFVGNKIGVFGGLGWV